MKLEFHSIDDIEEGSFVFGKVPVTGSVVESNEEFGIVNSCFDIFEYFVFVSIHFLPKLFWFGFFWFGFFWFGFGVCVESFRFSVLGDELFGSFASGSGFSMG
jgi:hypothetical protein